MLAIDFGWNGVVFAKAGELSLEASSPSGSEPLRLAIQDAGGLPTSAATSLLPAARSQRLDRVRKFRLQSPADRATCRLSTQIPRRWAPGCLERVREAAAPTRRRTCPASVIGYDVELLPSGMHRSASWATPLPVTSRSFLRSFPARAPETARQPSSAAWSAGAASHRIHYGPAGQIGHLRRRSDEPKRFRPASARLAATRGSKPVP